MECFSGTFPPIWAFTFYNYFIIKSIERSEEELLNYFYLKCNILQEIIRFYMFIEIKDNI